MTRASRIFGAKLRAGPGRRASGRNGITATEAVQRAELALADMAAAYHDKLADDVARLDAAISSDAGTASVTAAASEIETIAPTFGHTEEGRVAASLCRYLRHAGQDPDVAEISRRHRDVLAYVFQSRATAVEDGAALVDALEHAVSVRIDRQRRQH